MKKYFFLTLAFGLVFGLMFPAYAADFPDKDLQGIIMWGAGGGTDNLTRAITPNLEPFLGKQIVLINKPGGTGAIATQYVLIGSKKQKKYNPEDEMKKVLVLHGINLNMFGKRDPKQYGTITLAEIDQQLQDLGSELGLAVECFQTNHEGEMAEKIHQAHTENIDAVIINAGAWTHYSYGIMDALGILKAPIVEVHMSHVQAREEFRHHSVIAPLARGQISGFGVNSYLLGLRAAKELISKAD